MKEFIPVILSDRTIIHASGKDVSTLLQGLLSCDMEGLEKTGDGAYGFLLTPQGRYLHELFIVKIDDGFLIDVLSSESIALIKRLKMYTLRGDAVFAPSIITGVLATNEDLLIDDCITITDPRHEHMGKRVYGSIETLKTYAGDDEGKSYHARRVELVIPAAEDFVSERTLLLDYDMDQLHAIDFEKGCYVGQEVTARMYYRNVNKKGLYSLLIEGDTTDIKPHSEISSDGNKAGNVLSLSGNKAIALLRHEYAQKPLDVDGVTVTATRPAWAALEEQSVEND